MKYSENMLAIPLWIRKYIYDYTSTVDTDNGEMNLLAYRNILYIEDNFTKGDLAIYNVPLVKTQMKKIIVTAKTLYSHPKNVSKIYAALHTDLAW